MLKEFVKFGQNCAWPYVWVAHFNSVSHTQKLPNKISTKYSYLDFFLLSLFAGNLCFGLCTLTFLIICHTPNDVTSTFAVCHIIAIRNADTISCPECNSSYETYTSIEGRQKKKRLCVFSLIKSVTIISDTQILSYRFNLCVATCVSIKYLFFAWLYM